jgi:hypothetical protein
VSEGRYGMHELARQYAWTQLMAVVDEADQAQHAHAAYYTDFLGARRTALIGAGQQEAAAEIVIEIDNIRAAWRWACDHADADAIGAATHTLTQFYLVCGFLYEGAATLERAINALRPLAPSHFIASTRALLLSDAARLHNRLGQLKHGRALLDECMMLMPNLD